MNGTKVKIVKSKKSGEEEFSRKTGISFRSRHVATNVRSLIRKMIEDFSMKTDVTSPEMSKELGFDVIANSEADNIIESDYTLR